MITNILLGLIAFLLGLVVTWLFVLCKVIQDKNFGSCTYTGMEDVSPDMMNDLVSAMTCYYQCANAGDTCLNFACHDRKCL